jgi:DNA-binding MarR family transcriptional regulator
MKPLGITRSQWWVLANLSRHNGGGMMQAELARILGVGKVTVGGLVDRLEDAGYVRRRPDASDRRAKRVFITHAGYRLIEEMASEGEDLNTLIAAGISSEDIATAEKVLGRMKSNLRKLVTDEDQDFEESEGSEDGDEALA